MLPLPAGTFDSLGYIHAVIDAPLPDRVRRVLLALEAIADADGWAYGSGASHLMLSLACEYSPDRTVVRALGEAEAGGWLQKFRSVGRAPNSYRLLVPSNLPGSGAGSQ